MSEPETKPKRICKRRNTEDLTGQKFGYYTVLYREKSKKCVRWMCRCDCGTERSVRFDHLKNGGAKSCGCMMQELRKNIKWEPSKKLEDLVGLRFNNLTVVSRHRTSIKGRRTEWLCLCDCGKERIAFAASLKTGGTNSCGCKTKDNTIKPLGPQVVKILMNRYRRNSQSRGHTFELSPESFVDIIKKPCFYCKKPPSNSVKRDTRNYAYNGIDRIDNSKGYMLGNVLPCCIDCNYIRGTRLTVEEMKVAMKAVMKYRKAK